MASIKANARKVMCIGRNYACVSPNPSPSSPPYNISDQEVNRDHIKELNSARPKQPFFFLKPSSSILPPNSGPVLRPKGVDLHYEVELGLIMGREVRDLDESDEKGAMDAIEGLRVLKQQLSTSIKLTMSNQHTSSQ